jgi:hypothetical protein
LPLVANLAIPRQAFERGLGAGGLPVGRGVLGAIALAPQVLVIFPHRLAAARQGPHPVKR